MLPFAKGLGSESKTEELSPIVVSFKSSPVLFYCGFWANANNMVFLSQLWHVLQMATMKCVALFAWLPVLTQKLIIIVQSSVWNPASAPEGICSVVASVNHLASVVSSTMIPTISQRRTSGRMMSARRNASASLIPGRLCVLILPASTVKYADF